jgi:hypothetical protein
VAQGSEFGSKNPTAGDFAAQLASTGLPFNRKERFFTGTVLPSLVCCDRFAHFSRFTELCGVRRSVSARCDGLQFFTEYNFAESVRLTDQQRFPKALTGRDTPDVMVYESGDDAFLLAVEAKMFHRPTAVDLNSQIAIQADLLRYIGTSLQISEHRRFHVALLPAPLADFVGSLIVPTITWEQVAETYNDVADPYWIDVLHFALRSYDDLVSRGSERGQNAEFYLVGKDIVDGYRDGSLATAWMGRVRGLNGPELAKDLRSGSWRLQRYECSHVQVPNRNWFAVARFVQKIEAQAHEPESESLDEPTGRTEDRQAGRGGRSGQNAELRLAGEEIVAGFREGSLATAWMGRARGVHGPELAEDLQSGSWRLRKYECNSQPVNNRNWFPIESFVKMIEVLPEASTE